MGAPLRVGVIFGFCLMAAAQTPVARAFKVTLADGSDAKLVVSDNSGVIEFRNDQAVAFKVPADSITEIIHITERIRRSTKAYDRLEDMCCGSTDSHLLSLLARAIAAPTGHAQNHYVEIHWFHNGDGTLLLELRKNDYLPFMDWLQQKSGTKWRDLDQERNQALKTIYQRASAAFLAPIRFPCGDNCIGTYRYRVLALDDRDATELFFFNGEVKPKNLVSIMPVNREWSVNTCVEDVAVLYGKCHDDRCDIDAILLPTLTYRIAKPGQQATVSNAEGSGESFCAQLQRRQRERLNRLRDQDRPTIKRHE